MPIATLISEAPRGRPLGDVAAAVASIADTLWRLQRDFGIAHRDIKPGNLYELDPKNDHSKSAGGSRLNGMMPTERVAPLVTDAAAAEDAFETSNKETSPGWPASAPQPPPCTPDPPPGGVPTLRHPAYCRRPTRLGL